MLARRMVRSSRPSADWTSQSAHARRTPGGCGREAKVIDEVLRIDVSAAMRQQALHDCSSSGSVAMMKAPTDTMRRRRYEKGPVRGFPGASSTWPHRWFAGTGHAELPRTDDPAASPAHVRRCVHRVAPLSERARHRTCPRASAHWSSAAGRRRICRNPLRPGCRTPAPSRRADRLRAQQLAGRRELVVVLGLGRELELAGAHEVTGDVLLLHHRLDRIDGRREGLVEGACRGRAELGGQR